MNISPCSYSVHAALIEVLMHEQPHLLLIDTRDTPRSRIPAWSQAALKRRFGTRYRWAGATLGNVNHATGGPIKLAHPATGIGELLLLLREGYDLTLLCGCRDYARCHLHVIVDLLVQHLPEVEVIFPEQLPQPETMKCLSVRQPWAWLLTHPDALVRCGVEPKVIENRTWSTGWRGSLLIHASSQVDREMFRANHRLDHAYWTHKFGAAGTALAEAMPQMPQEYETKTIVGLAELVEVVDGSASPWFVGPYGFVLQQARPIVPVLNYPGQLKLFDVPRSLVAQVLESRKIESGGSL